MYNHVSDCILLIWLMLYIIVVIMVTSTSMYVHTGLTRHSTSLAGPASAPFISYAPACVKRGHVHKLAANSSRI